MTNGATTRYAQDLALPLPQVLATTGATTATMLYGQDRLATVQGGTRTWDIADALGSVRLRLDDAGTPLQALRYDPWGVPQLGGQPQPWGFTGELHDPQFGLVNLRARWYDTNSGTFLQRDPYPGVSTRPFSQHPYAYAHANPVNYTDPSGRCVPGLDPGCEFIGLERVARFDLNWDDGREYWRNVDQLVQDAIVGPVDLLYNAATDAESQATIARGAQRLWNDKLGSAAIVGNMAIKPFTDIYNGIVCGDSVQLGQGLTGYVLILGNARYFRSPKLEANSIPGRFGGRGAFSNRPYDPDAAGGPIRKLYLDNVKVTNLGIDVVEKHLSRFLPDTANTIMINRLRRIAAGELQATEYDVRFYTHELREYVRYRKLGWEEGEPVGNDAYELWNNAHTATLEEYRLNEQTTPLYHPESNLR